MHMTDIHEILQLHNLRDTMARRLVILALQDIKKPVSHKEIFSWIKLQNATINLVTVYRTIDSFLDLHIIHKHPTSGGFLLCSMPTQKGHHGFLSCKDCGTVQEFSDSVLCKEENRIAAQNQFSPLSHTNDIVGTCNQCQYSS